MTMIRRGKNCNKYSISWPPTCIEIQVCIQKKYKKSGVFLGKEYFYKMRGDEIIQESVKEENSLDF